MKQDSIQARLSGWEFMADPGDGAGYFVKEGFPHKYVKITKLTSHEETTVEIPFSVLKLIAQRLEEYK